MLQNNERRLREQLAENEQNKLVRPLNSEKSRKKDTRNEEASFVFRGGFE